jgi:uncharacterized phage-like protein YoqJ
MKNVISGGKHICKVCAFTGYRPSKLPWGYDEGDARCMDFKFRLRESLEYLIGRGYADFLSGGALGFDLMAAELVLSLREKYPWIRLIMVIPFDGQADRWSEEQRRRWLSAIEASDKVVHISHGYDRGVFFRRNHFLVEQADLLLAAFDGQPGGTAGTVAYARRHGVQVARIPPVKPAMRPEGLTSLRGAM